MGDMEQVLDMSYTMQVFLLIHFFKFENDWSIRIFQNTAAIFGIQRILGSTSK